MATKGFSSLKDLIGGVGIDKNKRRHIAYEWQDYAYRLAVELDDTERASLYMRLVKNTKRHILEEAFNFVKGANNVKNKARLFMWKIKEINNSIKKNENNK